jgi:hypothetical protein
VPPLSREDHKSSFLSDTCFFLYKYLCINSVIYSFFVSFMQRSSNLQFKQYQHQHQPPLWTHSPNYNVNEPWNYVSNQSFWPEPQSSVVWNTSWTQASEQSPATSLFINKQQLPTRHDLGISSEKPLKFSGKQQQQQPPFAAPPSPCYFIPVTSQQSWDYVTSHSTEKQLKPQATLQATVPSAPSYDRSDFVNVKQHQNPWNPKLHNNPPSKNRLDPRHSSAKSSKRISDIEDELNHQSLYKTELCHSWTETGQCRYGSKCQFAHGKEELRPVLRHPKYKTEICKTFHTLGTCPYGTRCRFIHNLSEKKDITSPTLAPTAVDQLASQLNQTTLTSSTPNPHPQTTMTETSSKRLPIFQQLHAMTAAHNQQ